MSLHDPLQDSLLYSRAYWVSRSIIAWDVDDVCGSCFLYSSKSASLSVAGNIIDGVDSSHHDYKAYKVPTALDLKSILKDQLAVALFDSSGQCISVTGLQLPGVIDGIFSYMGPLGAILSNEVVSVYLWAPTAQLKESNGGCCVNVPRSLEGCYYVCEVTIYHPSTLLIEKCFANDPSARGLSGDGKRTFLVDLDSDALKPHKWDNLVDEKPDIEDFSDISICELHIRDFRFYPFVQIKFYTDYSLSIILLLDSAGILHLKKISDAGLSHIHLRPTFDDQKENWMFVDMEMLKSLPSDSAEQQEYITSIQNEDGYNWGVPKDGAGKGDGPLVLGQGELKSVNTPTLMERGLPVCSYKIHSVPFIKSGSIPMEGSASYYLRMNTYGFIENSTCVNNTASQHFMVDRLIVDDILNWVVNYKVRIKNILKNLSNDKDKIDGSSIFICGQGWNFGEVANNGRGIKASQLNLGGSVILGESPFGHPLQQGFLTGLSLQVMLMYQFISHYLLFYYVVVGMAANLKAYLLTNCDDGQEVNGSEISTYGGAPVAHASQQMKTINYVSAHDNETLFDIITLKTPMELSVDERCRINHLAASIIVLSQVMQLLMRTYTFYCVPQKNMFTILDFRKSHLRCTHIMYIYFSHYSNNWGVGLPPRGKKEKNWPLIKPRLASPSFKPHKSHMLPALENFQLLLSIRYSPVLFRLLLRTANAIQFGKYYQRRMKGARAEKDSYAEMELLFGQQLDPLGQQVVGIVGQFY
ncbi:hypothetical protein E3N88_03124 [Mikania micrantha]|uniref:Uncharacterized protein n=1 Tax=Mikania micrantha TaxID=192012 RepID=A0A5N6Q7Z7_9ASTR|nr:hypothetical protein E3N88_03124 [Mikania micrantha]